VHTLEVVVAELSAVLLGEGGVCGGEQEVGGGAHAPRLTQQSLLGTVQLGLAIGNEGLNSVALLILPSHLVLKSVSVSIISLEVCS